LQLCAKFLIEEPDEETMKAELKEAFRVYDKDAQVSRVRIPSGYKVFRENKAMLLCTIIGLLLIISIYFSQVHPHNDNAY
jgi:hypothetical protein